ncbi:hypothetical protein ABRY23_12455 [Melioribacteraceae bacterium 4301-Me]|uniref:hypothetical protein n=1 Tax=Pyranulibacter aquaticus TaxID=3163344 RepID=UPI00359583B6
MIKFLLLLVLVNPILGFSEASNSTDSIDVKKLVQLEIQKAIQKKSTPHVALKVDNKINENIKQKNIYINKKFSFSANSLNIRIAVMLFAAVAAFLVVYIRRRKRNKPIKSNLKENIQLIREEKFIRKIDPRLKEIRTKLCLTASTLSDEREVVTKARQMNIAKGELMLAMKMNGQIENNSIKWR